MRSAFKFFLSSRKDNMSSSRSSYITLLLKVQIAFLFVIGVSVSLSSINPMLKLLATSWIFIACGSIMFFFFILKIRQNYDFVFDLLIWQNIIFLMGGVCLSGGVPVSPLCMLFALPCLMVVVFRGAYHGLVSSICILFFLVGGFVSIEALNLPSMKFMISQEHMIIMHWFCLAVLFVTIVTMMVMNQYSYLLIYNEQQRVKETSAELSLTDPLTKIANRRGLNLLLKEKIFEYSELNKPFVLCYFDLNGFKEINDTFGHLTGDILLQTVTKRLSNVLRDSDCIARQGGDEFIIFMDTATNSKTFIERTAKRFLRVIQEDIILEDKRIINVGASLGFAVFPEHGDTIDKILSSADDAMYIAKKDDSIDWKLYSFQVE